MKVNFGKRVLRRIRELGVAALELGIGVIDFSLGGIFQLEVVLLIFLLGLAAVGLRSLFFSFVPWVEHNGWFITAFINPFFASVAIDIDAIKVALFGIEEAASFISGSNGVSFPKLVSPVINVNATEEFLKKVTEECKPFDEAGKIIGMLFTAAASDTVCPALRYMWPVQFMRPLMDVLVGFLSYPYDPTDPNANCQCDPKITPCPAQTYLDCVALGSGYLLLEVLLPIAFIALGWQYFGPALFKLTFDCVVLFVELFTIAWDSALVVIRLGILTVSKASDAV